MRGFWGANGGEEKAGKGMVWEAHAWKVPCSTLKMLLYWNQGGPFNDIRNIVIYSDCNEMY